jgi:hypothetical protein
VERTYAPRTVAIVALASLVLGFLVVFGGGMLLLRPKLRSRTAGQGSSGSVGGFADDGGGASVDAGSMAGPVDDDASANSTRDNTPANAGTGANAATPEPTQSAGITIGPASISRCFNPGPPTPIRGADCDRLADLDRHVSSRATQLSACARSGAHGRLSLVLDFRFSTSYANGWGSPTSNIPNPGNVAACVKNAILPLPYSSIHHEHDRYIVAIPIDW